MGQQHEADLGDPLQTAVFHSIVQCGRNTGTHEREDQGIYEFLSTKPLLEITVELTTELKKRGVQIKEIQ